MPLWEKWAHMNMCQSLHGYRDRGFWMSKPNSVWFLFVCMDVEQNFKKKQEYTRRTAG
jgi:hypothetical protein